MCSLSVTHTINLLGVSDELVDALVAAKVPDPFKELLDKRIEFEKDEKEMSDEAIERAAFEEAARKKAARNERPPTHKASSNKYRSALRV